MVAQIFGLDIGTTLIKVAEVKGDSKKPELMALGMASTPGKGALSEAEDDQQELATAIRNLAREARISTSYVVASLPESQIFTRVIDMPPLTDSELQSAIKYEAEQYIPIPLSEVKLDYQVLSRPQDPAAGKMEVLLVAAPKILINRYLKIIDMAGLKPHALETEVTSAARCLISTAEFSPTSLVLEIGAATTEISIVSNKKISFTRSMAIGGFAFTRAVAQDLGFEMDQAEQYKKTYGLDGTQLEGKIASSIKPIFDVIVNEVNRALAYWAGKHPEDNVKRLVITGGSAKMPGIITYLTEATSLEGQLGETWDNLTFNPALGTEFKEDGPFYSIAVGLALKDILE